MLLFSFTAGPWYATSSFLFHLALSLLLLLLYMNLDIYISNYLLSVESQLHIFKSKYSSIWQIDDVYSSCGVKRVYLSKCNIIRSRNSSVASYFLSVIIWSA